MTGTDAAKLVALARERGVWLFTNHGHLHRDGASSRLKYDDPSKVLDLSVVDGAAPGRQLRTCLCRQRTGFSRAARPPRRFGAA